MIEIYVDFGRYGSGDTSVGAPEITVIYSRPPWERGKGAKTWRWTGCQWRPLGSDDSGLFVRISARQAVRISARQAQHAEGA